MISSVPQKKMISKVLNIMLLCFLVFQFSHCTKKTLENDIVEGGSNTFCWDIDGVYEGEEIEIYDGTHIPINGTNLQYFIYYDTSNYRYTITKNGSEDSIAVVAYNIDAQTSTQYSLGLYYDTTPDSLTYNTTNSAASLNNYERISFKYINGQFYIRRYYYYMYSSGPNFRRRKKIFEAVKQ